MKFGQTTPCHFRGEGGGGSKNVTQQFLLVISLIKFDKKCPMGGGGGLKSAEKVLRIIWMASKWFNQINTCLENTMGLCLDISLIYVFSNKSWQCDRQLGYNLVRLVFKKSTNKVVYERFAQISYGLIQMKPKDIFSKYYQL